MNLSASIPPVSMRHVHRKGHERIPLGEHHTGKHN